jgi:dCMP deaminase
VWGRTFCLRIINGRGKPDFHIGEEFKIEMCSNNMNIFEKAKDVSLHSNDPSTKVGCVFFRDGIIISEGYNSFPLGVHETNDRWQRPNKYVWVEHAERNAIYKAARTGVSLDGSVAVCTLFPCADCARAMIQVGVKKLIVKSPDMNDTQWGFNVAQQMFSEVGVEIFQID